MLTGAVLLTVVILLIIGSVIDPIIVNLLILNIHIIVCVKIWFKADEWIKDKDSRKNKLIKRMSTILLLCMLSIPQIIVLSNIKTGIISRI